MSSDVKVTGDWIGAQSTQRLFDVYSKAGFQLLFVGGCVRDALLGHDVSDIDMCSDATPETAQSFLEAAGAKVVPTGIEHGTLTVIVDGKPHEVTTFRKDVTTDGRHAVVRFSTEVADDARRRDFTINALYADRNGKIIDPLGGLEDLQAGRVRFIENSSERIREDYLRILRYFRFHGRFGRVPPDPDTLDSISRHIEGLGRLSSERVTAELIKILSMTKVSEVIALMQTTGVLGAVLPGSDARFLGPLEHVEEQLNLAPEAVARLVALGAPDTMETLRLSNKQLKALKALQNCVATTHSVAAVGYLLGAERGAQAVALRCAFASMPPQNDTWRELDRGAEAEFPVAAGDLSEDYVGPALGLRLRYLKEAWLASDLNLSKQELLATTD